MRMQPVSTAIHRLMIVIAGPLLLFLIFTAFRISTIDIRPLDPTVSSEAFEFNTNPAVGSVALHSSGLGNPALNLSDGILYEEHFRGTFSAVFALSSGEAIPVSITRSDFDEDAMPDVVAGYATPKGGLLTLRRGNPDIISSMSIEGQARARRGQTTENPFLNEISVWTIPADPVFLASGDFNDDGHIDLVTASDGGRELHWFFGTGKGSFSEPSRSEVEGNITMLKAGEFGRKDGLAELVVGITSDSGSVVQIFKSPDGAFQAVPRSIDVRYPVVDIALDDLTGDDLSDLVIISKSNLQIVEAPNSLLKSVAVRSYELAFEPSAVETGNFATAGFRGEVNYRPQSQIALISSTGDLYLWSEGILSPVVTHFPNAIPGRIQLVRSRVADRFRDGLAILDGKTNQVHIVTQDHFEVAFNTTPGLGDNSPLEEQRLPFPLLPPVTLASEGRPVAILSTRYNQDALDDLILLSEGTTRVLGSGNDLSVALSTPMANFVVNDAGNDGDGNLLDNICDTGDEDIALTGICTLTAAIRQASTLNQTGITFSVPSITIPSNSFFPSITSSVIIDGRLGTSNRVMLTRDEITSGNHAMFHFDGAATKNSTVKNTEIFGEAISTGILFSGSSNNVVQGNYIHDVTGAAIGALANSTEVSGSSSITIGGLTVVPGTGLGNVLSGYHREGIRFGNFDGPPGGVGGHRVLGNSIGVDEAGFVSPFNVWGISVEANTTQGTVIGGTTDEARNIISGNNSEGIRVVSVENIPTGSGLLIQGNYIGTDLTGLLPVANDIGIKLMASDHTIGGEAIGARNVISGNTKQGVLISRSSNAPTMQNNTIEGNLIGLGVDGNTDVGNGTVGIEFKDGASFNKILDNTISSNGTRGIEIGGSTNYPSAGNEIDNNIIGLNEAGTDARPNGSFGIRINNASGTLIGKTDGNIISGNADAGIFVGGVLSTDNVITRNFIGTDIIGVQDFPNKLGIEFHVNASNNLVGGTDPEDANLIAYNAEEGIRVISAMGISILGNSIFMNGAEGIDLDEDGLDATNDTSTPNDPLDADVGPNGLQNFPVISSVKEGSTIVEGTLNSAPNKTYRIEFFSSVSEESDGLFEGEKFLGSKDVTTDGDGFASFEETFPGTETNISMTATDPGGNTSEFSSENPLIVNTVGNGADTDTTDGACNTGGTAIEGRPECSLRAAIMEANFRDGADDITFDIPGGGPFFINIAGSLPTVTEEVLLDGTTQDGFSPELPVIRVIGGAGSSVGLRISAARTTVKGLIISDFGDDGISFTGGEELTLSHVHLLSNGQNGLSTSSNVRMEGTEGNDAAAVEAIGNGLNGLNIEGSATLSATGLIRANGNGASDTRPNCGRAAGIFVKGTAVLGPVEAVSNCGSGVLVEVNVLDGGDLIITGDVLVRDNEGFGIRADGKAQITDGFVRIEDNVADGIRSGSDLSISGVPPDGAVDDVGIRLINNGLAGAYSTFDITFVGEALVQNNGFKKPANFPCFENRFGSIESHDGAITTDAITVTDNCGAGLIALKNITINGNAVVSDNGGGIGIWGNSNITLIGDEHEVSRNGGVAIWSADDVQNASDGKITVEGKLTVQNNGTNIPPEECEASRGFGIEGTVLTDGRMELDEVNISDNCFTGLWSRRRISIDGDARITGNTGHGIYAGDQLVITGNRHEISNNGGDGISLFKRNIESRAFGRFSGHLLVRNNNTFSRANESGACEFRSGKGGIYAPFVPLRFSRVTASGNCGNGIVGRDVVVNGIILANENTAIGVGATRRIQLTTGEICRNGGYGVGGKQVNVGSVQVCENGLGGIFVQGQASATSAKQGVISSESQITGASIENNFGDGILTDGPLVRVEDSNIEGNFGFGANTQNGSPLIEANNNWWGDASGPGGVGPGSGDAISSGVDATTWRSAPVGLVVSSAPDTIFARPGDQFNVSFSYRNWINPLDQLNIEFADNDGWLQNTASEVINLSDTLVTVLSRQVTIPAGAFDSQTIISSTATSINNPPESDSESIVVLSYEPTLVSILVEPDTMIVAPGGSGRFSGLGVDQVGGPIYLPLEWSTSDGTIDNVGNFVAGTTTGLFTVTARDPVSGIIGSAIVRVTTSVAVEESGPVPVQLQLYPAYPNPFNPTTTISYDVRDAVGVILIVYDVVGRSVATLVDRFHLPGRYQETFDARALPSGIYFIEIKMGDFRDVKSITLVK